MFKEYLEEDVSEVDNIDIEELTNLRLYVIKYQHDKPDIDYFIDPRLIILTTFLKEKEKK
jgi:hypothetical protein